MGRRGTNRDISESVQAQEKLRDLSLGDELTGLHNRRGFVELATQMIRTADRLQRNLTLAYCDLDKMKWINDSLGHKVGDQALVDTAQILVKSFRAVDVLARIGGDEFVVLALDTSQAADEATVARLTANLNAHNAEGTRPYQLSISVGLARYDPQKPCSLEELLTHADGLMYEQKQSRHMDRNALTKDAP